MANAAGGHYQAVGGGRPQFPAYGASGTGGYYQQQQQRPLSFQYYAPPPPQPPAPPGAPRFGGVSTVSRNPPPPPPPPPGEVGVPSPVKSNVGGAGGSSFNVPPLQPPPLPPMFPWMSPALAESMTNSQYGQNFREAASNLPFVPIIVNDADLAKMTENVIKEAEQVKSHQLQYYKDVMNQDLPQALKDMFQPLYCKLCTLTLSSPVVAKDHYSGKRHKKGVDGWILKNPDLCTRKQVRDAAGQGGGGESSSQQQNVGGTVVKTPGGGMAVTGPINGYIMKQQQQQTPQPSPPVQQQQVPPQPLLSMNFENNRKRPAPSPQLQQITVAPPKGQGPPQNTPQQAFNTTNKPSNNFIGPQKPEGGPSQSAKPPAQSQGVVLRNPGPPAAGNGGSWQGLPNKTGGIVGGGSDFQPKRPRREDETAQPGVSPSQQHRGTEREKGGGGGGGGPPPKSLCEICNVQLSSKVQADQHFNGRNHKAKLAALQEGNSGVSNTVTPPVAIQAKPGISSGPSSTTSENSTSSTPAVAGVPKNTTSDTNPNSNIFNKLLALSSQSLPAPVQPPPEDGIGSSFDNGNPFNSPSQHQPFSKPRGGGGGGRGGAGNSGGIGRGGGGGRGNNPGRGGGRGNHNNSNNRGGGGGGRGRGGGGGGPPFRNNNANNSNKNNFNNGNNNRFNNNNRGRR